MAWMALLVLGRTFWESRSMCRDLNGRRCQEADFRNGLNLGRSRQAPSPDTVTTQAGFSLFFASLSVLWKRRYQLAKPVEPQAAHPALYFLSPSLSLSGMQEVITPLMETTAHETHVDKRPRRCRSTASVRLQWVTCERLEILSKSHEWIGDVSGLTSALISLRKSISASPAASGRLIVSLLVNRDNVNDWILACLRWSQRLRLIAVFTTTVASWIFSTRCHHL